MKIKTEIQDVIWKINIKVGQKVDIGDTVVILESMKIEIPIESELRGTVKEILINEGDHVNEDQELVTIE